MEAKRVKLVGINGRYVYSCLPLFYLRNALSRHHPQWLVELLQFSINDNYFEMLLQIAAGEPDYVFLSAAVWNSDIVEKLVADLSVCLPQGRMVVGGPQAGVLHESLETESCTFVLGAIEAVPERFYNDLQTGCLLAAYEAQFFKMPERGYDFPYNEKDFAEQLLNRHIYYESARGCIFRCSYCLSAEERGVFHKPLEVVLHELEQILQHKPKIIRFIDRTFNDIPQRVLAIWKFLLEKGGETMFHFEMAPDRFTEEMYDFLEQLPPGKFQFEIGIQSTNQETLQAVQRPISPEVVSDAVQRLAKMQTVHLHVDLILGLPFETEESFARSFADVFFMGADYIQMGLLKILPNTPLRLKTIEYGYKYTQSPPYSVLENRWLSQRQMQELYWFSECVEKFMNNRYFLSLWRYLRTHREDIYHFFQQLLVLSRRENLFSRVASQEMLCRLLVFCLGNRQDKELLLDLLRFDWLRCGHRFLPDCLLADREDNRLQEAKNTLYQRLPEELEGVFKRKSRNSFFKKSCFLSVSEACFQELQLEGDPDSSVVCFLSSRENSLHSLSRFLVL